METCQAGIASPVELEFAADIAPGLGRRQSLNVVQLRPMVFERMDEEVDVDEKTEAQAVVLTTTSHLESVLPQISQCVNAGLNVISTCEELSYPWKRSPELAQKIEAERARRRKLGLSPLGNRSLLSNASTLGVA